MVVGRFLSQTGTGFTLFFAPLYFVNQVGLSATQVGIGLAAVAVSGVIGRIAGGSLSDNFWGRRPTLLLSLALSGAGSVGLALSLGFVPFILSNLVAGLGDGLYWPCAEAIVADLSQPEQRNEAFGLNRLADNLGHSVGVTLASAVVVAVGAYRLLFVIDALTYLLFFAIVLIKVQETRVIQAGAAGAFWAGWGQAFQDRALMVFLIPNSLLTMYVAQLFSSLPLYFNTAVRLGEAQIGYLFALQGVMVVCLQIPIARYLNRIPRVRGLSIAAGAWGIGFGVILLTGIVPYSPLSILGALLGLAVISIALMIYNPSASSLIVDLAPPQLRGVYFSVNSLCWAAGFMVGPAMGGAVLDLDEPFNHLLWLGLILTTGIVAGVLRQLNRQISVAAMGQ